MKQLKRLLACVLAVAMVLSLVACGGNSSDTTSAFDGEKGIRQDQRN